MSATVAALESCPECGGRGWIIQPDGGVGSAVRCSCHQRNLGPRLLEAAGIPPRYRACRLTNFHTVEPDPGRQGSLQKALSQCRDYVERFYDPDHGRFRESGLLYLGPPGVGKTHLAVAVLGELIQRYRVRGRFVEFTSLVHQIQATFDPGSAESKRQILDPLLEAEVLVLDELGAQKPSPWVNDILYFLVNTRYTHRRPTLFTTNYRLGGTAPREESLDGPKEKGAPDERFNSLASRLAPALVSRLHEMAEPVRFEGVLDFRYGIKATGLGKP
jgi:DNA replication protein DnaC